MFHNAIVSVFVWQGLMRTQPSENKNKKGNFKQKD